MEHDVFISHAHKDKSIADAICEKLESAGLKCWIPARDISASDDWTEATRNAIRSSLAVVLVLSENANAAHHIEREIAHAFYTRRVIIPFRVANTLPRRNLLFYIGNVPWLNAASPPAEQHLEALTARIQGVLPDRTVTRNALPPRSANQPNETSNYPNSWIGALRASHYRTLGILKWAVVATCLFAVGLLLWFALQQTKDGVLLAQSNLRSTNLGSTVSPKPSSQAGGDALQPQPTYSFTRFGLWQAANPSPTPSVQPGAPDTALIAPAEGAASLTPSPRLEVTPGQRTRLTPTSESPGRPLPPPEMHRVSHNRHQYHKAKAQEGQKNAGLAASERDALQSRLKQIEARVQTTQKYADLVASQRDALQNQLKETEAKAELNQKNANLAASRWAALKAELEKAEQKAQLAQHIADFAVSQQSELETQLRKAQEEKAQLAQREANLAGSHDRAPNTQYQKEQEDPQPANEDADLAVDRPESERTQPPNPGQNAKPVPLTLTLDSSVQSDRP